MRGRGGPAGGQGDAAVGEVADAHIDADDVMLLLAWVGGAAGILWEESEG